MLQHLLNIHFQAFAHTFSLFSDEAGKHFNYMYLLKPASSSLLPFLVGFTFRSFLTKRPQSAKLRKPYMHIPYKKSIFKCQDSKLKSGAMTFVCSVQIHVSVFNPAVPIVTIVIYTILNYIKRLKKRLLSCIRFNVKISIAYICASSASIHT